MLFRDRREAGRELSGMLEKYAGRDDAVVLALPRGGVPVGREVANALRLPLDVFLVRKLGTPGQEELAMGAIASGGVRVVNLDVVRALDIPDHVVSAVAAQELRELVRRERSYRGSRPPIDVHEKVVILVDDGLATGSSMLAAVLALRERGPTKIVVAVPVASASTCDRLRQTADEVVCMRTPEPFLAVGRWYHDFTQTSDDEVRRLLAGPGESNGAAHA